MSIFVVLHEDRHTDVEPYLFQRQSEAIAKARELAGDEAEEQELTDAMERDGWLLLLKYSTEGDSVTVMRRELH